MKGKRQAWGSWGTFGILIAAILHLSSCSPGQQVTKNITNAPVSQFSLYVNFNGPWALMQDPDDPTKIVAVAPFIMDHQSAYVAGTNETPVLPGIYQLTGPAASNMAPNPQLVMVNESIKKSAYTTVLNNNNNARYLIRLPMPADINAYRTGREAVASSWQVPNPDTVEKNYTTSITLHYNVSDFGGIKFTGTTDSKKPLSFIPVIGVTGVLDIGVGPLYDLQENDCHDHGKAAFKALVDLLGVKQYIDFPGSNQLYNQAVCKDSDPQNPKGGNGMAHPAGGRAGADCKAAMLSLTVNP
jgi:hypothetical protein